MSNDKKIDSIIDDYWILFLSICGLIFIAIATYSIFRPKILADNEVMDQNNDQNVEHEEDVDEGGERIPRVKEKDPIKKKELMKQSRLKAKQDLSQYKEACKESQLSNRRVDDINLDGGNMEYGDDVSQVTVEDILIYFNTNTQVRL